MNTTKIHQLADHVEVQEDFDMGSWRYRDGCPACMAGHAVALFTGQTNLEEVGAASDVWTEQGIAGIAMRLLGIGRMRAEQLFTPELSLYRGITPKEAAWVLRRLAATGKVDWESIEEA